MSSMAEFVRQLAAEAEQRGLRIVIEPVRSVAKDEPESVAVATNPPAELHAVKAAPRTMDVVQTPKIVSPAQKEQVIDDHSWITVSQCARMLKVSTSSIYNRIRNGMIPFRVNASGAMTVNTDLLNGLPQSLSDQAGGRVPVQCVETGKCYASMAQASRSLKVSVNALQKAMITNDVIRGYHFRPVDALLQK